VFFLDFSLENLTGVNATFAIRWEYAQPSLPYTVGSILTPGVHTMNRKKTAKNAKKRSATARVVRVAAGKGPAAKPQSDRGRIVTLAAEPGAVDLDLTETVVMVVDMQNDFGSKGGMFDRAGFDISIVQRAIPPTAKVLTAARRAGIIIVYLKMGFRPDLSDIGAPGSPNRAHLHHVGVGTPMCAPNGTEGRILVRNTWNTEIVNELQPEASDIVLYKNHYSGFFQTDLDKRLRRLGTRSIIFTGCTTSVCVESTLRDAMFRDYSPILLADCSGEVVGCGLPRSNHEASVLLIKERFGWVSTSDEFLRALEVGAKADS